MEILHITPVAPGNLSGGEIGVRQTLLSISGGDNAVDYMGPDIGDKELESLYRKVMILPPNNNLFLRIYDALHLKTNQRYRAWRNYHIDYDKYDAVVLDFTRQHYVLERISSEKLVVRVHNVERDYAYNNLKHKKSPVNFVEYLFAGSREAILAEKAARLIVLTSYDKARLRALYGIPEKKIEIIPVCINGIDSNRHKLKGKKRPFTMILNGSLWFGPNYEGIKWFLSNVYPHLNFRKYLIIAGSKPNRELKEIIKGDHTIQLVDTPPSMAPYLELADMAIAPIFDGAGMKVKVAEALSYQLPVLGTPHAFVGYEIKDGINSYIAETAESFVEKITLFQGLSQREREKVSRAAYALYKDCYSQLASTRMFRSVIESVL